MVTLVALLSGIKWAFHSLNLEVLSLNALFTSAISGCVFIVGFLLASLLSDYKEAERLPADVRVAMEALRDDAGHFAASNPDATFNLALLNEKLVEIVEKLESGLHYRADPAELAGVVSAIDQISPIIAHMERDGMPPNYVVRLRGAQDSLRRAIFRIYHIQKIQFVPSVHVLVQTLVMTIVFLLLLLETEGSPESAIMFGFISYILIYALYLVRTLEQPFHKGLKSVDDVSLFLLREFADKVRATGAK